MLKENVPLHSSESNTIIRSPLSEHGEEIPAMNASPDAGHATSRSSGGPPSYSSNTINTSPYGDHTPSPSPKGTDTSRPSPYGVHTASTSSYGLIHTSGPPPYGDRTLNPSPYGLNTSRPSPFGSYTPSPLLYGLNTSSPSSNRGHLLSTQLYGHANPGPSLYGGQTSSPSLYDLDTPGPSPAAGLPGSGVSLSDSGKASDQPQDRRDSGSSSDQGNIPPGRQEQNAWTPCDRCKGEVERILQQKRKIDEVLSRIVMMLQLGGQGRPLELFAL
nr:opioid growth factor receptor-like [Nothobranchius furzeri]